MRVFLGGTCNGSDWREKLIPMLTCGYFNPVVDDWDDAAYRRELFERETCDCCLYVLTPKMIGCYSVAEVIDDSNKRPEKTALCILSNEGPLEFTSSQIKSLSKTEEMVRFNGGKVFSNLNEVAAYLNSQNT